jgi:hypothetical protein
MIGVALTLACSVVAAFYFICNDIFRLRGDIFVFWRSLFAALMMSPVLPFLDWNLPTHFFIIVVLAGVAAGLGDMVSFNAARIYSASAISRIAQFRNIFLFLLWPFIVVGYWDRLSSNPLIMAGCFVLIFSSAVVMFLMRKNPVSVKVIWATLPVIFFIGASDILFSLGMDGIPSLNIVFVIAFIFSLVMVLVSGMWLVCLSCLNKAECEVV